MNGGLSSARVFLAAVVIGAGASAPAAAQPAVAAETPSGLVASQTSDGPTAKPAPADAEFGLPERPALAEDLRHELTLSPAAVQVNFNPRQHVGATLGYGYRALEWLTVRAAVTYNYVTELNDPNAESICKASISARGCMLDDPVLLQGAATVTLEVPFRGKVLFGEGWAADAELALNVGTGLGLSRVVLDYRGTLADGGMRALGTLGLTARVFLDDWFLQLDARDLIYSSDVDTVNGCSFDELTQAAQGGAPGGSCDVGDLSPDGVNLARLVMMDTNGSLLHNFGLGLAAGLRF